MNMAVRRRGVLLALATLALVSAGLGSGGGAAQGGPAGNSSAAAARVHWGRAELVPGLAALNKGSNAAVNGYTSA
jgi:hypothetical protein